MWLVWDEMGYMWVWLCKVVDFVLVLLEWLDEEWLVKEIGGLECIFWVDGEESLIFFDIGECVLNWFCLF